MAPGGIRLFGTLAGARSACDGRLLVVEAERLNELDERGRVDGERRRVTSISPEAFCNVDPYRPPRPVEAAGGYVARRGEAGGLDVLLIHRRGVWDLPKGKCEAGESVEECALREVREEIGVRALRLRGPLGQTVHGYARDGAYHVKTTHWFLMYTSAETFTPQAEEDIERVAWYSWVEAQELLGYATLRRHMANLDPDTLAEHFP